MTPDNIIADGTERPATSIVEAFLAQVSRTPHAEAVRGADATLTYAELDASANRVAQALIARGVGPGARVGLCAERCAHMLAGMLGILKSGAAYVPLDPELPAERVRGMLEDCAPIAVVRAGAAAVAFDRSGLAVVDVESLPAPAQSDAGPGAMPSPTDLAYVLYTSGSTGRPKGVAVEQRSVLALWRGLDRTIAPMPQRPLRVALNASMSFDVSVQGWSRLLSGDCVAVVPQAVKLDPSEMLVWLEKERIDLFDCTPSQLTALVEAGLFERPALSGLSLVVAGEAIPPALWRRMESCAHLRFFNAYGPTEGTVYATAMAINGAGPAPRIGVALPEVRIALRDNDGHDVADAGIGEICIGGVQVARGYLHRPELTAERFVTHPAHPGERWYRTGDLARRLDDGTLEYLGRNDDQIKLRGYRIELGEIESALREHPAVRGAAAVVVEDPNTGPYLRCAVETDAAIGALRAWLSARLPAYMLPGDWHALERLPLSNSGKIDRAALRALSRNLAPIDAIETGDDVPDDAVDAEVEATLGGLWRELLGVDRVAPGAGFLALGGQSILAARLSRRIADAFGVAVPVAALLRAGSLRRQAALIVERRGREVLPALPRQADQAGPAPATPAQARYWAMDKLLPGSCRYNIVHAFRFEDELDTARLDAALRAVCMRAPALRTVCAAGEGGIVQRVLPVPSSLLRTVEIDGADAWDAAVTRARAFAAEPFDLERDAPFRALAVRVPGVPGRRGQTLLAVVTHHIAADGSAELLHEAIASAYARADAAAGADAAEEASSIDYAAWLASPERTTALQADLAYWSGVFATPPSPVELPADRTPSRATSGRGGQVMLACGPALRAALAETAQAAAVTPFQALLALTWACLARLGGQTDICVAVPSTDRHHPAVANTIGGFVNTVLMRGTVSPEASVADLLRDARACALDAQAHGFAPIDRVVAANPALRTVHGALVANVMVSALYAPAPLDLAGARGSAVDIELPSSRFDLSFFFRLSDDDLQLTVEYDADRFERTTAERLGRHWITLAEAALADPGRTLGALPLLTAAERHRILETWNDTARPHAETLALHEMFERSVRRRPEAVALATGEGTTTYAELDAMAEALAARVLAAGIGSGDRVAVLCDRRPHLIAALLGVLKAGGAYVPLDPDSPEARQDAMLRIAGAKLLIFDATFAERGEALVQASGGAVAALRADDVSAPVQTELPRPAVDLDRLAYIIFTSGSTGTPKAVAVRHRPVYNIIDWVNRTGAVGPDDRLLFVTSVSFDLSVYDIFGILAAGGSIRIAARADVRNPQALADILVEEPITFWDSAPIALDQCVPYLEGRRARALRLVFLSGDWVPVSLPDRIRAVAPDTRVIALGGATEAVIWSNAHEVGAVDPASTSIPYGRPIQNARYHILDAGLEPVPPGVPGDLFIAGDVLAEGYHGDERLTAERFVRDPFRAGAAPGAPHRMYRTGDRARYFDDGVIEFLGRLDNQVKIRGFRIETSEIETALAGLDGVRAAHVAIRGEKHDRWLCAYAVVDDPQDPDAPTRLLAALRARLPEYMLPRALVPLAILPLNSSGKVDRARLPEPEFRVARARDAGHALSRAESDVLAVWRRILANPAVGVDDNFFDVGGDSARLIGTHRALEAQFGRRLPMVELFRHTTVRAVSAWLSALGDAPDAGAAPAGRRTGRVSSGLARVAAQRANRRPTPGGGAGNEFPKEDA